MITDQVLDAIRKKMQQRGLGEVEAEDFVRMVRRSQQEKTSYIPLDHVSAPDTDRIYDLLAKLDEIKDLEARGVDLLSKTVVIKLNGGRSTTMGGDAPKGILVAKDGLSYLEIIVRQMQALWNQWNVDVPLVLMNSFFTDAKTHEVIDKLRAPVLTFLQSQVPRLVEDTLMPLESGSEEDWVPPGHGDVYPSLKHSGLLDKFLAKGRKWAFISNLDNLAAGLEPWIVGLLDRDNVDFLMEVTDRTEVDRKGGTLVVHDGRLDLLEIAQVTPDEKERFMDIDRFRVFNTNNLWVNLEALKSTLEDESLNLPIIHNRKTIAGTSVIQFETAMGAAVGSFSRTRGLRVSRDRFFPTKKVEDLFVLQSDACVLDDAYRLKRNPLRPAEMPLRPSVEFSKEFLDNPIHMSERFADPASVSLVEAESLKVSGSVFFEQNVCIQGNVEIQGPEAGTYHIDQGTELKGGVYP